MDTQTRQVALILILEFYYFGFDLPILTNPVIQDIKEFSNLKILIFQYNQLVWRF